MLCMGSFFCFMWPMNVAFNGLRRYVVRSTKTAQILCLLVESHEKKKKSMSQKLTGQGPETLRHSGCFFRFGLWFLTIFCLAVIEFSERLSYFGVATSLIIYLTKVIHQDLKTAARNVNYWAGVTTLMPLFGGFLADAYFGRFTTVFLSSVVYLLVNSFSICLLKKKWQGFIFNHT
jgi:hypothetical protein